MASINIEKIIDHLEFDIRRSLEASVEELLPGATFDTYQLFRVFKRKIVQKRQTWEPVPDACVDLKCK